MGAPLRSDPVDAAAFRAAMARFPGAVTIITALSEDGPRGITATAVCSVSADPPSVLVCVNRATGTCAAIEAGGRFNVNLLAEADSPLALRFAGAGGITGGDKFAAGTWTPDARGLPLLEEAVVALSCDVTARVDSGSHAVFIGQIMGIRSQPRPALVYEQARFHRLAPV